MEEALIRLLLNASGLTALVSTRINWSVRPRDVSDVPAIVLHRIGGLPQITLDGPSGHIQSRVQVDCWALTYASALAVSRAVKSVLNGFRGPVSNGASPPTTLSNIQGILPDNEQQSFEVSGTEAAQRYHRVSLDYLIWHD